MNINSLDGILEQSRLLMKKSLESLERVPWKKAARLAKSKCGCYMIYNPAGDLLYVGATKNLGLRLSAHLSTGLVVKIASERGAYKQKLHVCTCGASIKCGAGSQEDPAYPRAIQEISAEIKNTYTVAFIPVITNLPHTPRDLEDVVQAVLKPKYGMSFRFNADENKSNA